jgi:hypothetical protein
MFYYDNDNYLDEMTNEEWINYWFMRLTGQDHETEVEKVVYINFPETEPNDDEKYVSTSTCDEAGCMWFNFCGFLFY